MGAGSGSGVGGGSRRSRQRSANNLLEPTFAPMAMPMLPRPRTPPASTSGLLPATAIGGHATPSTSTSSLPWPSRHHSRHGSNGSEPQAAIATPGAAPGPGPGSAYGGMVTPGSAASLSLLMSGATSEALVHLVAERPQWHNTLRSVLAGGGLDGGGPGPEDAAMALSGAEADAEELLEQVRSWARPPACCGHAKGLKTVGPFPAACRRDFG